MRWIQDVRHRLAHLCDDETGCISLAAGIALASAASTTATGIYQSKKAGSVNERAIDAQAAADQRALENDRYAVDQQREEAELMRQWYAEQEQAQRDYDQGRWDDYIRANQPYWAVGNQAFAKLSDMAGLPAGAAPGMPQVGSAPMGAAGSSRRALPPSAGLSNLARPSGGVAPGGSRGAAVGGRGLVQPMPTAGGGMSITDLVSLAELGKTPSEPRHQGRVGGYGPYA